MATASTAAIFHSRVSRLQEAAVVLQERAWVQEAVGDLGKKGKFLLDVISTKSFNQAPSAGAAVFGISGLFLPSRLMESADIILNDSLKFLLSSIGNGTSKVNLPLVHAQTGIETVAGRDGQRVGYAGFSKAERRSPFVQSAEEEDYEWETDPNGGWLSSFA